jgi:hypothetical protein
MGFLSGAFEERHTDLINSLKPEAHLNNIKKLSSFLKENNASLSQGSTG